jgi:glycosyltransferase involved in cell wall biosynthesis
MSRITIAVCAYNAAATLPGLVEALRAQACPIGREILIINNNSRDNTAAVVEKLAVQPGAPVRIVHETTQGIPYARNRAIVEALAVSSEYLAFMDSDELPTDGWLAAAVDALAREGAEAVGGAIEVMLPAARPRWLSDELLGFLGALEHGHVPFWIDSQATPIWSGNIAYRTALFADGLRFDVRYNRQGRGVGGGSDGMLFRTLLARPTRMRYRPDMRIQHHVEDWKLKRRYFLQLHYLGGRKAGEFTNDDDTGGWLGLPPWRIRQACAQSAYALTRWLARDPNALRQAMNAAHAWGWLAGRRRRHAATTRT